jgi:hypothetical protein
MILFEERDRGLIEKISFWWKFNGKYLLRNTKEGIKNIIYWLPIIWKDRNYDHTFIYEILKHKLKAQSKYIGNKDRHTTAKRDARRMLLCANLLQICQDDTYSSEYTNYSEDKYWFEPCNDGTTNSTLESENIWETYDDYFKKYPLIYKRVINGEGPFNLEGRENDKRIIAMNISKINQERAHKLLFKIIEENIQTWWD